MNHFKDFELGCTFHPYQQKALETLWQRIEANENATQAPPRSPQHLLLLAPPGSGKTLMGLACALRRGHKTLILSPNTTLQYQWAKQWNTHAVSFSELLNPAECVGFDPAEQPLILSSTYQLLSSAYRQDNTTLFADFSQYTFIILDECHHVRRQWGEAILALEHWRQRQNLPPVLRLGLTATPPIEVSNQEKEQLHQLLGDVDYAISLPAMIRSGRLAPFQDLIYLVRPSAQETRYIQSAHQSLHALQTQWAQPQDTQPGLALFAESWLLQYQDDNDKDLDLYLACLRYLHHIGILVQDIHWHPEQEESLTMDDHAALLGAYALKHLGEDHPEFETLRHSLDLLGYRYRQGRFWPIEGQVEKVLGLSSAKYDALSTILNTEYTVLHDDLRCLVLTDFALTHTPGQRSALHGLKDPDAGGALSLFRHICLHHKDLKPILMTGQYLLCCPELQDACLAYLQTHLPAYRISTQAFDLFYAIEASPGWSGKDYVATMTDFFSQGESLCLVGTRGLLGEGWDCPALNTLIDFTRTTTFVSVNQIRGRTLRKDPQSPLKVANQWDVVALIPELESGLKDLERWQRKHQHYYGLCDDGLIEKGVGHVHASFTRRDPQELFLHLDDLNSVMLARATQRLQTYDQWKIGSPYQDRHQDTLQITPPALSPPSHLKTGTQNTASSPEANQLNLQALPAQVTQTQDLRQRWISTRKGQLASVFFMGHAALWSYGFFLNTPLFFHMVGCSFALWFTTALTENWQEAQLKRWATQRHALPSQSLLEALGKALWEACLILEKPDDTQSTERQQQLQQEAWQMLTREDGTLRFISLGTPARHRQWQVAFQELLAPLQKQRYWLSFYSESQIWYLPVPHLFGRSKRRAHVLVECLKPVLGEIELHYMRQDASKALLPKYQLQRPLPLHIQEISVWS